MHRSIKIVIPSHGRWDTIKAFDFIPENYHENVYVVTRAGEQYEKYVEHRNSLDGKWNVIFCDVKNIAEKRHFIANHFAGEKIWMLDDDCTLYTTVVTEKYVRPKEIPTEEEFYEMLEWCSNHLDTYPHMVIMHTIFPRAPKVYPYRKNVWCGGNAFLNLSIVNADLLQYNVCDHAEDTVAYLSVVDAGYDSLAIVKWLIKTVPMGATGGITSVRTPQLIEDNSRKIHKMFPDHTRLKKSKPLKSHPDREFETLVVRVKRKEKTNTLEGFFE